MRFLNVIEYVIIRAVRLHFGICIAILVAWVLGLGLVPELKPYVEAVGRGHALRQNTEYRAALQAYTLAHRLHPHASFPSLQIAETYLALGRADKALPWYEQASADKATDPTVLTGWGQAYQKMGDTGRAVSLWQQIAGSSGCRADASYLLGIAALESGHLAEARTSLEASLAAGNCGHFAQAASYWLGLLRTFDDAAQARNDLQQATRGPDKGLADNARAIIQVLAETPDGAPPHRTMGAALFNIGHWQLAQVHLEQALADAPADVEALTYLGGALDRQGEGPLAESRLRQALALKPDQPLALYFWGKHQARQGELAPARETFERILALDPMNAAACAEIGRIYTAQRNYSLAETWFEKARDRALDRPDFYLVLASFESDSLFNLAKGLEAARQAVALEPDNALAYDIAGWLSYVSGQRTEAETALQRAIALEPGLISAYYHLGRLYESQQRIDSARRAYGRVVDLGADNPVQGLAEEALKQLGGAG